MLRKSTRWQQAPALIVSGVALFAAITGAAVALPGTQTVNSGDVKNESLKSVDLKDGAAVASSDVIDESITGTDILDGSVASADVTDDSLTSTDVKNATLTGADVQDGSLASADVQDNTLTANDLAANSVESSELAADAVNSSEVADRSLNAVDVGADSATITLNFPPVAGNTCQSLIVNPPNANALLGDVVSVTPGAGFSGLHTIATEVQNNAEFAVKICDIDGAQQDPDGANGTSYSYIVFEG